VNQHKLRSVLLQDISFCYNKTQHYKQKLTTDVNKMLSYRRETALQGAL